VVGDRGSVVESDSNTKLKKIDVQEGKKDKSRKTKVMKSMYITDARSNDLGTFKYIYEFHQYVVADRVWKALMVLEDKEIFSFPNVSDCCHESSVLNVKDRQMQDDDFQEFLNMAMEHNNKWPLKGSTRKESMQQLANCSWLVDIVEE